jgi:hypothetical protein
MMSQIIQYILSIEDSPMSDMDFNPDLIREFCGCLIRFEFDNSITFAHYTVLEYLKSDRISRSDAAYFALLPTTTIPDYTKVVILAAQSRLAHPGQQLSKKYSDQTTDFEDICFHQDLTLYFSITAIACTRYMAKELEPHGSLFPLMVDFWNPVGSHFKELSQIPRNLFDLLQFNEFFHADTCFRKFIIPREWEQGSYQSTATAIAQLIIGFYEASSTMIEKFLSGQNTKRLFATKLAFSKETFEIWGDFDADGKRFRHLKYDGSLPEVVAQLSSEIETRDEVTGNHVLSALLNCQKGPLDWSPVLVSYVGFHMVHQHYERCGSKCVMYRLLENGADPDSKLYGVTPLQIATACCDIAGVQLLLERRANPNSVGNSTLLWTEDHPLEYLNCLSGYSPLDICRGRIFFNLDSYYHPEDRKGTFRRIEELLMKNGAVADLLDSTESEDDL